MSDLIEVSADKREASEEEILRMAAQIREHREKEEQRADRDFPLAPTPKKLTDAMIAKLRWRLALAGGTTKREAVAACLHLLEGADRPTRPATPADLAWLEAENRKAVATGRMTKNAATRRWKAALRRVRLEVALSEAEDRALREKQAAARAERWNRLEKLVGEFLDKECGTVVRDEYGRRVPGLAGGTGEYEMRANHYRRVDA